jgi:DNA-binding CsgD family transcriptional regulator
MLLDRVEERAILDELVRAASKGSSGSLVLYGDAGMGKTELLDYASSLGDGLLIRIAGVEAESHFAFAGLHRLLLPFLDTLDQIPKPQQDALSSAFGLTTGAPADQFLVGLATLTLLANAAKAGGMVCVIDDCHWIDIETLQTMAFVGRRIRADGIALIFGLRASSVQLPELAGLPVLEIGGLPDEAAVELVEQSVPGPIDGRIAHRIVADTSGCPLALIELAQDLSAGQWVGSDPLSEPIPISRRLEKHFRQQFDALPTAAQVFLLVAAAETSGDPDLVRKVAAELGSTADAEEHLVRERFVTTKPRVDFRHPLIRSAIYAGAKPSERKLVHRALVLSIDRELEPERWVHHACAIADGPDEDLAAHLETAALRAQDRGGYAAEASLMTQSGEFTVDPRLRCERFLRAADAALNAGAPQRFERLLSRARSGLVDPLLRAEAEHLEGRSLVSFNPGRGAAALLSAARQFLKLDRSRARSVLLEAMDAYAISQHLTIGTSGVEIAETALATRSSPIPSRVCEVFLDSMSLLVATGYVESVDVMREAARLMRDGAVATDDLVKLHAFGNHITNELMDERSYATWVTRVVNSARKQGALIALQVTLVALAVHEVRSGHFSAAEANYAEVLEVTAAVGGPVEIYRALNAELLAWRGDEEGLSSAAQIMIKVGTATGSVATTASAYRAVAIAALGAGRYGEAFQAAEHVTRNRTIGAFSLTLPILIEAGVRSGHRAAAEQALAELTIRARASATPWALGLLSRSEALLAEDTQAGPLFEAAIRHLEQTSVATDLATTRLAYGEWLRRQNRRIDARNELRQAYEAFASMGAQRFAERARVELLATGERTRRRTEVTMGNLTPQESQIAKMASRGATNPEIAAQLFLSTSTVDYHLRKVYRKLGITSRRQLERALA